MHAAGWFPADPVTLKSSLEIALEGYGYRWLRVKEGAGAAR